MKKISLEREAGRVKKVSSLRDCSQIENLSVAACRSKYAGESRREKLK